MPLSSPPAPAPTIVITPFSQWWRVDVQEWWQYRHVLVCLVWRDILTRYKQTVVGILWVVLQPMIEVIVLSLVFGRYLQPVAGNLPYPLFVLTGIVAWSFFAGATGAATSSVLGGKGLVENMYFPRVILPFARVLGRMPDLFISVCLLGGLLLLYGIPVQIGIIGLVPLLCLLFVLVCGVGLMLSALHTLFRDIDLVVPYCLRIGLFLSPVLYATEAVPASLQPLYALNPLVGIIESSRALLSGAPIPVMMLAASVAVTFLIFTVGLFLFQRLEPRFLDVL